MNHPVSSDDLIAAVDRITDGGTRLGLDAWCDVTAWLQIELDGPCLWDTETLAEMILVAVRLGGCSMNPLTTRKKAALLRKLGFAKSRMQMTRAGTTYMKGRAMITIAKGDQGGGGWILVSPGFTLQAMMMNVENLAEGFRNRIQAWHAEDPGCPDPAREDYGTGAYRDDLFRWAAATVAARH